MTLWGARGTRPPVEKQVFKNLGEKLYRLALLVLALFMFFSTNFKALNPQKPVASEDYTPNPPEILLYTTVIHAVPVL